MRKVNYEDRQQKVAVGMVIVLSMMTIMAAVSWIRACDRVNHLEAELAAEEVRHVAR